MSIPLPQPIADFVAANARLDIDAMLAPFAHDAVVRDLAERYEGKAELRCLFETAVIPVAAVFTPDTMRHEGERVIVEGPVHGTFPGSPIRFTYAFKLEDEMIAALDISL